MAMRSSIRATRHVLNEISAPEFIASKSKARSITTDIRPEAQSFTGDVQHDESLLSTTATVSQLSNLHISSKIEPIRHTPPQNPFIQAAQCTLYSFPRLEPVGFTTYPSTHLLLPLRRDILHRAVVYEADAKRQGTASTKWRDEVHGSGRKVRPQKGTGKARLGDKKSPMLRGGGVAHGPKPRDFSTELPRKIYDLAWRTALSYRYRRGQLLVVDKHADLKDISRTSRARYLMDMLQWHSLGYRDRRTLIITDGQHGALTSAFEDPALSRQAQLVESKAVDVKDLLYLGRIIIEQSALDRIFREHETDLTPIQRLRSLQAELSSRGASSDSLPTSIS